MVSLAGKVMLVTGGARGIGRATAELSKRCGAEVACCDVTIDEALHGTSADGILWLKADVSREEDCEALVGTILERLGRLDVLVNNAGILEVTQRTVRQDVESWKRIMDVNLLGTFLMSRAAARAMVSRGIPGSIVNVSSVTGLVGFRASNAYGVSKAAVGMLTKTLCADLASRQIRVNAVAPGFVSTAMTTDLYQNTKLEKDSFIKRIPLERFGDADEVAKTIVFLASDWASYITGAVIPVDGGWSAFGGPS